MTERVFGRETQVANRWGVKQASTLDITFTLSLSHNEKEVRRQTSRRGIAYFKCISKLGLKPINTDSGNDIQGPSSTKVGLNTRGRYTEPKVVQEK